MKRRTVHKEGNEPPLQRLKDAPQHASSDRCASPSTMTADEQQRDSTDEARDDLTDHHVPLVVRPRRGWRAPRGPSSLGEVSTDVIGTPGSVDLLLTDWHALHTLDCVPEAFSRADPRPRLYAPAETWVGCQDGPTTVTALPAASAPASHTLFGWSQPTSASRRQGAATASHGLPTVLTTSLVVSTTDVMPAARPAMLEALEGASSTCACVSSPSLPPPPAARMAPPQPCGSIASSSMLPTFSGHAEVPAHAVNRPAASTREGFAASSTMPSTLFDAYSTPSDVPRTPAPSPAPSVRASSSHCESLPALPPLIRVAAGSPSQTPFLLSPTRSCKSATSVRQHTSSAPSQGGTTHHVNPHEPVEDGLVTTRHAERSTPSRTSAAQSLVDSAASTTMDSLTAASAVPTSLTSEAIPPPCRRCSRSPKRYCPRRRAAPLTSPPGSSTAAKLSRLTATRTTASTARAYAVQAAQHRKQRLKAYVVQNLVPNLSDFLPGASRSTASLVQSAAPLSSRPAKSWASSAPGASMPVERHNSTSPTKGAAHRPPAAHASVSRPTESVEACVHIVPKADTHLDCTRTAMRGVSEHDRVRDKANDESHHVRVSWSSSTRLHALRSNESSDSLATSITSPLPAAPVVAVRSPTCEHVQPTPTVSSTTLLPVSHRTTLFKAAASGAGGYAKRAVPRATLRLLYERVGVSPSASSTPLNDVHADTVLASPTSSSSLSRLPLPAPQHTRQTFYALRMTPPDVFPPMRSVREDEHWTTDEGDGVSLLALSPPIDLSAGDPRDSAYPRTTSAQSKARRLGQLRQVFVYNAVPHPRERARSTVAWQRARRRAQDSAYVWSGHQTTTVDDDGAAILPCGFEPLPRACAPPRRLLRPNEGLSRPLSTRSQRRSKTSRKADTTLPRPRSHDLRFDAMARRSTTLTQPSQHQQPPTLLTGTRLHALDDSSGAHPPLRSLEICAARTLRMESGDTVKAILRETAEAEGHAPMTRHACVVAHTCRRPDTGTEACQEDPRFSPLSCSFCGDGPHTTAWEPVVSSTYARFYYDDSPHPRPFQGAPRNGDATDDTHCPRDVTGNLTCRPPQASAADPCDAQPSQPLVDPPLSLRAYHWEAACPVVADAAVPPTWHARLWTVQCGPTAEVLLCLSCQLSRQCNRLNYGHPRIFWPLCVALCCLDPCTCARCSSCLACVNRATIRARFGIPGSFLEDGAAACCCTPCAVQQNLLEMRARGECPGGWCFLPLLEPPKETVSML